MKKRAFSLFLAVCIIFTLLPDLLLPASAKATPDIRIKITDSTGKESLGYGDSFSDAITDSGTVAGAVYSIEVTDGEITTADWNYIKGNRASFSALRSFTVSDAVYTVADMPELTFQSCTSLTDIDIPAVETIGQYAFQNCPGLTDVGLPKATTLRDYAFYDCPRLADVALPELISAGERAFAYCSSLTEVSLPKLTSMGEHMFYNCEVLTYAEIPKVTSIGANAFKNCLSLNTLKVQGTPPAVGTDAFLGNPETRKLIFVDANGDELTGGDLDNARAAYKAAEDGDTGDNLWYGWIIPLDSISLDIGNGNIEASAGLNSVISVKQSGSLFGELPQNGMITITGTSDTNKIVVDGVYADITLDDISIDVRASENACAFELKNGANADLTLSGDNSLTSGVNRAGLEVAAGQSITIAGDGSLTINYCNYGAGIGGSHSEAGGNITVLNGDITAESHSGAGIGGGYGGAGGTINISGGEITAKSYSGAGIGGGRSGAGGTINISGGIVNARSCDFGAGIGGGYLAGGGNITVSGGAVTAQGSYGAGIGGGYNELGSIPYSGAITIMDTATVKASADLRGKAINPNNGSLETGSTAKILYTNFASRQNPETAVEVYSAVYDTSVTGFTPVSYYDSIAFTLPEGAYNLKTAGNLQQYTNAGAPTDIDFVIPHTAGIYIFDEVEDAPVLTSVSISGTARVGQTLTAVVSPAGATATLQWKADSTDITGATGNTYVPAAADVGKAITVTATATGEWFGTVTSSPTSPVLAATNNNNDNGGNGRNRRTAAPEKKSGLPYYMKDGKKVFIGFSATGEYIVPEGVTVLFGENPKNFTDIENHWAKSSIEFVTEREIFQGMDENSFGPEISMTRGMFVTVIGRLYERSYGNITGNTTFSDVDSGSYYSGYVAWAHENGIIEGIGGDMFDPEREISHEQMAAIMFRFAKFLGKGPQGNWMINVTYPDSADISDWAMESAAYCQLTGIITGGGGGKFAPKAVSTRAEVAAVIERFVNEMLK